MAIDQHDHGNPKFWPCGNDCLKAMLLNTTRRGDPGCCWVEFREYCTGTESCQCACHRAGEGE